MRATQPKSHEYLWRYVLLPLLFILLAVGLFIVVCERERFAFLFALAAFSIAYALHFFSVSGTLCGIYIREPDCNKARQIRDLEYPIVTSAMCALAGGLIILITAGLLPTELGPPFALWTYAVGALLLLDSVIKYVFCQRDWPRVARAIVYPPSTSTTPPTDPSEGDDTAKPRLEP